MFVSRLCGVSSAALLVTGGSLFAGAGPAHAVAVDQSCVGTEVVSYDPPVTLAPKPVTITVSGIYPGCTNPAASNGTYSETFKLTISCLELLDSSSATSTLEWGNPEAEPSTFRYHGSVTEAGGQLVATNTGVITDGLFAPASAEQVITFATPNTAQCLGSGISDLTGVTTLTVYQP